MKGVEIGVEVQIQKHRSTTLLDTNSLPDASPLLDTSSLHHSRRNLKDGGQIIVVDTGAVLTPEIMAMIQAKHSRSSLGFDEFVKPLTEQKVSNFMTDNYVGYGDKSIGDCGWATVFIEGVSMLAPKAVQDWMLYNGQESSTRYMDFSSKKFFNPLGTTEGFIIQEVWRKMYKVYYTPLYESFLKQFPIKEKQSEPDWRKSIRARTLDVLRGFLPAGAATNFSWTMPLRQFKDELLWLRHHPLEEIREIAREAEDGLNEIFPNSGFGKHYKATEDYTSQIAEFYTYYIDTKPTTGNLLVVERDSVDRSCDGIGYWEKALSLRPPKAELPKKISECGTMQFRFALDFGSYRDLQRHRSVTQQMPLLGTSLGIHPWYLKELETAGLPIVQILDGLQRQERRIYDLDASMQVKQYYTGMGYLTANRLTGDIPALVWIAELRGTRFVHPTLRERAIQLAEVLECKFGEYGLVLHVDKDPHVFDVRRGKHDIGKR